MSAYPISSPAGDVGDSMRWERLTELKRLCDIYLRKPEDVTDDGTTLTLVFTPDLTAPEEAMLRRIIRISGMLRITPAEWGAIEPDIDTMQLYLNEPTPTGAQTATATKSIIRVLRAILRD